VIKKCRNNVQKFAASGAEKGLIDRTKKLPARFYLNAAGRCANGFWNCPPPIGTRSALTSRIWLSGPRIFGIRPGISFSLDEFNKPSRSPRGGSRLRWVIIILALWAAISGLLFSMTLAHGGTRHVYQDGADTVQASRSPTRTATDAFMAKPTQVLIGIPAKVERPVYRRKTD
jgi:hypothetical protein